MKDLDGMPKQCCNPIVASSEFTEGLRLLLKDFSDGLNRAAALELDCKWMLEEVDPRLVFVLIQSRLKEGFEDRGLREGSHITNGRELYGRKDLIGLSVSLARVKCGGKDKDTASHIDNR